MTPEEQAAWEHVERSLLELEEGLTEVRRLLLKAEKHFDAGEMYELGPTLRKAIKLVGGTPQGTGIARG